MLTPYKSSRPARNCTYPSSSSKEVEKAGRRIRIAWTGQLRRRSLLRGVVVRYRLTGPGDDMWRNDFPCAVGRCVGVCGCVRVQSREVRRDQLWVRAHGCGRVLASIRTAER